VPYDWGWGSVGSIPYLYYGTVPWKAIITLPYGILGHPIVCDCGRVGCIGYTQPIPDRLE